MSVKILELAREIINASKGGSEFRVFTRSRSLILPAENLRILMNKQSNK